jgi:hypothetical protein
MTDPDPYLDALRAAFGSMTGKVAAADVWVILGLTADVRTQADNRRVGLAMRALGFEHARARIGGLQTRICYRRGTPKEREREIVALRDPVTGDAVVGYADELFGRLRR